MADKYNIPYLQSKAAEVVESELRAKVRSDAFPQIVQSIFEEAPPHDGELLQEAAVVCRSTIVPLMQKKAFKQLLLHVPELGLKVMGLIASEEGKQ